MFAKFFDKLSSFLFDFIGLFIPGIVAWIIFPLIYIFFNNNDSVINKISSCSFIFPKNDSNIKIILLITLIYLTGHVAKVLSVLFYNLGCEIFNKKVLIAIEEWKKSKIKFFRKKQSACKNIFCKSYYEIICIFIGLVYFPLSLIIDLLIFKGDDFLSSCECLNKKVLTELKNKYDIVPERWFVTYKISNIIEENEEIKSHYYTFLAKYNCYRSIAFIFFCAIVFSFYLKTMPCNDTFPFSFKLLIIIIAICWYTFHYKFKRYWALSGNEALISLFYYFKIRNKQ